MVLHRVFCPTSFPGFVHDRPTAKVTFFFRSAKTYTATLCELRGSKWSDTSIKTAVFYVNKTARRVAWVSELVALEFGLFHDDALARCSRAGTHDQASASKESQARSEIDRRLLPRPSYERLVPRELWRPPTLHSPSRASEDSPARAARSSAHQASVSTRKPSPKRNRRTVSLDIPIMHGCFHALLCGHHPHTALAM